MKFRYNLIDKASLKNVISQHNLFYLKLTAFHFVKLPKSVNCKT